MGRDGDLSSCYERHRLTVTPAAARSRGGRDEPALRSDACITGQSRPGSAVRRTA